MKNNQERIQELLNERASLSSKLNLLSYSGSIDIKVINGEKYIYLRKRENGKLKSQYIGKYSDELYGFILRNLTEAKEINKVIRKINKELEKLGYVALKVSDSVKKNIDFAKANIKNIIFDQAMLEGVAATFPQTEQIIDNGKVEGVSTNDVLKIINLKHAWEFILDEDVINSKTDLYLFSYIAKIINNGFFYDGGKIRSVPVKIGGTNYVPPVPNEVDVKEEIENIINSNDEPINVAINLCLFSMKRQIFLDGNKRASVIFANQYLIGKAEGIIVIPNDKVDEFKRLLIEYYESGDGSKIFDYVKDVCWMKM